MVPVSLSVYLLPLRLSQKHIAATAMMIMIMRRNRPPADPTAIRITSESWPLTLDTVVGLTADVEVIGFSVDFFCDTFVTESPVAADTVVTGVEDSATGNVTSPGVTRGLGEEGSVVDARVVFSLVVICAGDFIVVEAGG